MVPDRNRRLAVSAIGALTLSCVFAAVAVGQSPSSDTTTKPKTHKAASSSSTTKASAKTHTSSKKSKKKKSAKVRGQQKIDSERAQAIQEALIREHYLNGEPTGNWNEDSEAAMRRYQADHGWQSKTVPDSRALIKLGLGPSKDHLLNPESAMTTVPDAPKSQSLPTTSSTTPAVANPPAATSGSTDPHSN